MVGSSWLYRCWDTVKTGSEELGVFCGAPVALLACWCVAPAATSPACRALASLIREPSPPIVTTWPDVTSDAPPWPVMAARAGQLFLAVSRSPFSSPGAIVAGIQLPSQ